MSGGGVLLQLMTVYMRKQADCITECPCGSYGYVAVFFSVNGVSCVRFVRDRLECLYGLDIKKKCAHNQMS